MYAHLRTAGTGLVGAAAGALALVGVGRLGDPTNHPAAYRCAAAVRRSQQQQQYSAETQHTCDHKTEHLQCLALQPKSLKQQKRVSLLLLPHTPKQAYLTWHFPTGEGMQNTKQQHKHKHCGGLSPAIKSRVGDANRYSDAKQHPAQAAGCSPRHILVVALLLLVRRHSLMAHHTSPLGWWWTRPASIQSTEGTAAACDIQLAPSSSGETSIETDVVQQ